MCYCTCICNENAVLPRIAFCFVQSLDLQMKMVSDKMQDKKQKAKSGDSDESFQGEPASPGHKCYLVANNYYVILVSLSIEIMQYIRSRNLCYRDKDVNHHHHREVSHGLNSNIISRTMTVLNLVLDEIHFENLNCVM